MMKKIYRSGITSMILLACISPEKPLNRSVFTQTIGTAQVSLLSEGQNTGNSATLIGATSAYGHTPGHTMFMVESGGDRFLIWGDITHATAIQMPYPAVAVTYDVNPGQAVDTRHKVMDYVTRHHIPVAGAHIAYPGMGKLLDNRRQGYLFQPADLKENVQQAVREQLKKYPESRLQDIYKNFFQDYFGPEHLIADTAMAAKYLRQELDSDIAPTGTFFEPAGWEGRFYRVNLSAVKEGKIPYSVLLDAFLRSANHAAKPPLPIWHTQWDDILSYIDALQLSLPDYETDKAALQEILQSGRYAVHHSEAFNDAYHPHYRIVSRKIVEEELKLYLK